jgi:hypothetical protein
LQFILKKKYYKIFHQSNQDPCTTDAKNKKFPSPAGVRAEILSQSEQSSIIYIVAERIHT